MKKPVLTHQHSGPSLKLYLIVWGALMFLLLLTWGVGQINLGKWNAFAALTIALVKMLLVMLIFMHVRYSSRVTWLFAAAGFIWLVIMIDLTLSDFLTRDMVKNTSSTSVEQQTPAVPTLRGTKGIQ
jgi:cytochrome c oxidase subunit 4